MYFAFRLHHILPMTVYEMSLGERILLQALIEKELEDRKEEAEAISDKI